MSEEEIRAGDDAGTRTGEVRPDEACCQRATLDEPELLDGAEAIARFLGITLRRTYYLCGEATEGPALPAFRLGRRLCARPSTLRAWLAERERLAGEGGG